MAGMAGVLLQNGEEDPRERRAAVAVGEATTGRSDVKARSWETPEGDKRSVVEVEADEIGPSLRWATAKAERAAKDTAKPKASGQFNDPAPF
jgi:hypothetical protein